MNILDNYLLLTAICILVAIASGGLATMFLLWLEAKIGQGGTAMFVAFTLISLIGGGMWLNQ